MVFNSTMSESDKEASSKGGNSHPTLDITTMVPNDSGDVRGFPQNVTNARQSSNTPNGSGVHNESVSTSVSGIAHIQESFTSQGISSDVSDLLLASWRPKTKSNYNSLFAKWSCWCVQRNRDPTVGPVEDILNFLAELFKEGYL